VLEESVCPSHSRSHYSHFNIHIGVPALIPPSTFLSVLPYLAYHTTPPISTRSFRSGLTVLHTPPYSHPSFTARLFGLIALMGPLTTMEIAQEEKLTVSLAREMIGAAETDGHVCRDCGSAMIKGGRGSGTSEERWWQNIFRDYVWDGEVY
jgi:ESCRT-II complex subunit VPS36